MRIAAELLREFEDRLVVASLSDVERTAEIDLPKAIVRRWRQVVGEYHQVNPPAGAEWDRLDPAEARQLRKTCSLFMVRRYSQCY